MQKWVSGYFTHFWKYDGLYTSYRYSVYIYIDNSSTITYIHYTYINSHDSLSVVTDLHTYKAKSSSNACISAQCETS